MYKANKGDWVQIYQCVLKPEERAPQIPDDTKLVPLELWVKGFITSEAEVGELVEIKTVTGRLVKGELKALFPYYTHSFGKCVPELLEIDKQLKSILYGGNDDSE